MIADGLLTFTCDFDRQIDTLSKVLPCSRVGDFNRLNVHTRDAQVICGEKQLTFLPENGGLNSLI
jgi:hypothetical protein